MSCRKLVSKQFDDYITKRNVSDENFDVRHNILASNRWQREVLSE